MNRHNLQIGDKVCGTMTCSNMAVINYRLTVVGFANGRPVFRVPDQLLSVPFTEFKHKKCHVNDDQILPGHIVRVTR